MESGLAWIREAGNWEEDALTWVIRNDDGSNVLRLVVNRQRQIVNSGFTDSVRRHDETLVEPAQGAECRGGDEEFRGGYVLVGVVGAGFDEKGVCRLVHVQWTEGVHLEHFVEDLGVGGVDRFRLVGDTCLNVSVLFVEMTPEVDSPALATTISNRPVTFLISSTACLLLSASSATSLTTLTFGCLLANSFNSFEEEGSRAPAKIVADGIRSASV